MEKADYSKIAALYDKGRPISKQNVELWLCLIQERSRLGEGARTLDLGCGTGRFALPMAERLRFRVTGADSSSDMLAKAREKDASGLVTWDVQNAESLTYPDGSFDLVFVSHLLHHVDCPGKVIAECYRVLDRKGVLLVRYGAIEQIWDDVEHTFFPAARDIDKARGATTRTVEAWLHEAGFSDIASEEVVQRTFETPWEHLNAVKAKGISVLTMISEDAFERGARDLAKYIEAHPSDAWLLLDRLTLTVGHKSHSRSYEHASCP